MCRFCLLTCVLCLFRGGFVVGQEPAAPQLQPPVAVVRTPRLVVETPAAEPVVTAAEAFRGWIGLPLQEPGRGSRTLGVVVETPPVEPGSTPAEAFRTWIRFPRQERGGVGQTLLTIPADRAFIPVGKRVNRKGEDGFRALYTMRRDGSGVRFLAAAPGMISSSSPEWSHDGRMVAFDAVPAVGALSEARIFVYAVEGPFKGTFQDLGCGNVPSWSPDDRQIAYMLNGGNPAGEKAGLWVMNSDGSNRRWLLEAWYGRWSPDGKSICAYSYQDDSLRIIDVASNEAQPLLGGDTEVKFGGATWSPDGRRLVFVGAREGKEILATVNLKSAAVRVLYREDSPYRALIGPPSWSPDGKQIVFAVEEKDKSETVSRRWAHTYIYSIAAEVPSAPVLLEKEKIGLVNRSMMWSPDSRRIVFSSER